MAFFHHPNGGTPKELKTCEYCGTSFDASLRQCPLCGKAVEPSPAEPIILNAGGEPAAPRRHHRRRTPKKPQQQK